MIATPSASTLATNSILRLSLPILSPIHTQPALGRKQSSIRKASAPVAPNEPSLQAGWRMAPTGAHPADRGRRQHTSSSRHRTPKSCQLLADTTPRRVSGRGATGTQKSDQGWPAIVDSASWLDAMPAPGAPSALSPRTAASATAMRAMASKRFTDPTPGVPRSFSRSSIPLPQG
jgi:hypothetical protein